jgi:hypothetical protein
MLAQGIGPIWDALPCAVSRDSNLGRSYCLIRECSRGTCRCLTNMLPVPHRPVPVAASLAAVVSGDVAPKTRRWAIVRRHTFMRRCNVRNCPSG